MKLFVAILCLLNVFQIHALTLTTITSTLNSIVNPVIGATGGSWRQYVLGLTSLQASVANAVVYAQLNGTNGVSGWLKLEQTLTSTNVVRFLANITDIGDLLGLNLISTLNNDLNLKYIELDNKGSLLFPNGLSLSYNGTSGSGYSFLDFQIPSVGNVVSIVSGLSDNLSFITNILSQAESVTNVLTSLLSILTLPPIIGGLLGGL
jgi:hypothetical protein